MNRDLAGRCTHAVHVVTPTGQVLSAGRASLYVLGVLGWRRLAALLSIRPLLWFVEGAYGLVASHRRFVSQFVSRPQCVRGSDPAQSDARSDIRLQRLKLILGLALVAGFLLTPKLWVSTRSYPLMPVSALLPEIPFPFDYPLFVAMVALAGTVTLLRNPRASFAVLFVVAGSLSLLDQSRWQPWFYQYLLMLASLALWHWHRRSDSGETPLNTCRLVVCGVYVWSGLHKLNRSFISVGFPWFLQGFPGLHGGALKLASLLGVTVPIIEAGIGLGLLTTRWRRPAIILAILMHTFILTVLGPLGHNVDQPVWPWNLAMIALVVTLFRDTPNVRAVQILWPKYRLLHVCTLILIGILPALSFVQLWDSYLSFSLFGDVKVAHIQVSEKLRNSLPSSLSVYVTNDQNGRYSFDYHRWGVSETHVPVYPETRIYKRIARLTCRYATTPSDVELTIGQRSLSEALKNLAQFRFKSSLQTRTRYDCESLGSYE
jgi:hypothetical protein